MGEWLTRPQEWRLNAGHRQPDEEQPWLVVKLRGGGWRPQMVEESGTGSYRGVVVWGYSLTMTWVGSVTFLNSAVKLHIIMLIQDGCAIMAGCSHYGKLDFRTQELNQKLQNHVFYSDPKETKKRKKLKRSNGKQQQQRHRRRWQWGLRWWFGGH